MTNTPPLLRQPNWVQRNWQWTIPALCLVFIGMIGLFYAGTVTIMKSSDAYTEAVVLAKANAMIVAELGAPVQTGFFISGTITTNGTSGRANFAVPLHGPNGKATLYVFAVRKDSQWHFIHLVLILKPGGQQIEVTPDADVRI